MYCMKCGQKLSDGNRFCPQCGNNITGAATVAEVSSSGALDKPAWDKGTFVLLCILSLGFAIVGIPLGLANMKYASRVNQAKILLKLGLVSLVIGILVVCAGV